MQRVGWVGGVKQEAKGGQAIKKREPSRSFNQRQTCVSRREVAKIDQIYRLLSPNEIIPMHKFKEKYAYSMYYTVRVMIPSKIQCQAYKKMEQT